MNYKNASLSIIISLSLIACTSPTKNNLLPDGGPTTAQLVNGGHAGITQEYGSFSSADQNYSTLLPKYAPKNERTSAHVDELRRDFKHVPNPEIIGYVYPHINNNRMPIPGYFTVFRLYDTTHYALSSEGYNVQ